MLIHDPVTEAHYELDPESRAARKLRIPVAETGRRPAIATGKSESLGSQIPTGFRPKAHVKRASFRRTGPEMRIRSKSF